MSTRELAQNRPDLRLCEHHRQLALAVGPFELCKLAQRLAQEFVVKKSDSIQRRGLRSSRNLALGREKGEKLDYFLAAQLARVPLKYLIQYRYALMVRIL